MTSKPGDVHVMPKSNGGMPEHEDHSECWCDPYLDSLYHLTLGRIAGPPEADRPEQTTAVWVHREHADA